VRFITTFAALSLFAAPLFGVVKVDSFFGDHMVVQRDSPVVVWGVADKDEQVLVTFAPDGGTAKAKFATMFPDGRWRCELPAKSASVTPHSFFVSGKKGAVHSEPVVIRDVLVGDVWVCAGQSNMEFPMSREAHAATELPKAGDAQLRLLNHTFAGQYVYGQALKAEVVARFTPEKFYTGSWAVDSSTSAAPMSAAGYYFARTIRREAGVPVGLINYAVGGIPIESFMAVDLLKEKFPAKVRGDWTKNDEIDAWCRGRALAHLGSATTNTPRYANGPDHAYKPGFAFAAGVGRITDFPVRGVLWYQGESNAIGPARVAEYPALFVAMVADWRAKWSRPDMPFYYAQLSSCASGKDRDLWPEFRAGQRRVLAEIPGPTGMVVTSDVGAEKDVHPGDKKTVGERFARWALRDVYGKPDTVVSGPIANAASRKGGAVLVSFGFGGGLKTSDGAAATPVEVAGSDGRFVTAEAKVECDILVVSASSVLSPKAVRYGWKPYFKGNLVNGDGLPASTFLLPVR
jgi:sialate O-acetylesterase